MIRIELHLLTKDGIQNFPKRRRLKSLFCRHPVHITGRECSERGFMRVSGSDTYVVCRDCGKVLDERHSDY